jgi:chromosome segregation ATPase
MTDREHLDQIERYILDLENSFSDLAKDQSKMRIRIEKIENELVEIKARLDKTLTYDAFEHLINAMLDRLAELNDLRKTSRKHENDILRVEVKVDEVVQRVGKVEGRLSSLEQKVDNLEQKVDNLEQKVDNLEQKVDNLEQKMDSGFAMLLEEIQKIQK